MLPMNNYESCKQGCYERNASHRILCLKRIQLKDRPKIARRDSHKARRDSHKARRDSHKARKDSHISFMLEYQQSGKDACISDTERNDVTVYSHISVRL